MATDNQYDVIIIGGGPAGLTAGLYTSRSRLKSLLIEKSMIGGQIVNTEHIENFPGFPDGVSGFDLGQLILRQAQKYGLEIVNTEVTGIELNGKQKLVKTNSGNFTSGVLIIAGGLERQKLDVPGEVEFTGKGVSYCATCDAALFRDQPVAIVGGGNGAVTEALHLAKFASKVTLIHRRRKLRATPILQERASADPKIEFLWDTVVEKIEGDAFVRNIRLRNLVTGEKSNLEVSGIFVAIGARPKPDTDYLKDIVPLDEIGRILTNEKMETEIPGILAAGDIRHNSGRQAITAAGDGATAAIYAEKYLTEEA